MQIHRSGLSAVSDFHVLVVTYAWAYRTEGKMSRKSAV